MSPRTKTFLILGAGALALGGAGWFIIARAPTQAQQAAAQAAQQQAQQQDAAEQAAELAQLENTGLSGSSGQGSSLDSGAFTSSGLPVATVTVAAPPASLPSPGRSAGPGAAPAGAGSPLAPPSYDFSGSGQVITIAPSGVTSQAAGSGAIGNPAPQTGAN
jgi:membrane protease subunit (stomatin/prohibitin family)